MVVYNPLDGNAITSPIPSRPRHCFLMTRLGNPIPREVRAMHRAIANVCESIDYLKRAFLITGNTQLRRDAKRLLNDAGLTSRAKNSVEQLAASF
jgi:hypothetical protein